MAKHSITRRWIFNNLGVVVLAILVIDMAIIYAVQNYFYSSAKQYLVSKLNAVTSVLSIHSQDSSANFSAEMRKMLETFNEKDKIELMAINSKGRVVLTSSGFSPEADDQMPDYGEALQKSEGDHIYRLSGGEKVLAVSVPIDSMSREYSAVRMVTSLSKIDDTIKNYAAAITIVCLAIILIIVITGLYFARSIVRPIRQISGIARKFAMGDFSTRIENDSDDEIGDLCTAINNMADELSATEAMKNEFISSVSHELRTPLTAIKGWAETLMIDGGGSPDTMKKGVGVIVNETERLSQMVEELLDFSRMQNGHFTLQNANMDILAELGDAVLIYSDKARREDKEIIYNEPEMLPFVYGDKNRIRQVFINVIDNAVKYSSAGDTVTIMAYEKGGSVVVMVTDTGCGIKSSDLSKVKTKFYKANHTRRGSGIGLAVADEIITMHGGTMDITSEGEGKGTTVVITLPAVKS
ncbi:HAMP domain-containing sensor histidine kinase [Ruminococcus sp.]|uniref:sensor histidine kinase n=1 Tax=Ruminococcus sp. TaxID=41978 RepID=UPI001B650320|nr:HAMP domain-containing sensor histidine kinase [Ruminococcus sp.]MBP5433939.1 HAMP domain-containing protein [Ruminococcus sp.]